MDDHTVREANRRAWDVSAHLHRQGDGWARLTEGFARPGYSVLDPTATAALVAAGVVGASVVQLGCNNGREILSALTLGARRGLGIDQSGGFLDQARELAAIAGADCEFLEADICALPEHTPGSWDIALVTIGVLNWMPDLASFFAAAAGLLAPGGRLVVYETHPFLEMFDPEAADPFSPAISYFHPAPIIETGAIVYDGSKPGEGATSFWFVHPLGKILTACAAAGLKIEAVEEFPHSNRETDYDRYEGRAAQLPMSWTLRALKD